MRRGKCCVSFLSILCHMNEVRVGSFMQKAEVTVALMNVRCGGRADMTPNDTSQVKMRAGCDPGPARKLARISR
jgi:hypothetical protein